MTDTHGKASGLGIYLYCLAGPECLWVVKGLVRQTSGRRVGTHRPELSRPAVRRREEQLSRDPGNHQDVSRRREDVDGRNPHPSCSRVWGKAGDEIATTKRWALSGSSTGLGAKCWTPTQSSAVVPCELNGDYAMDLRTRDSRHNSTCPHNGPVCARGKCASQPAATGAPTSLRRSPGPAA